MIFHSTASFFIENHRKESTIFITKKKCSYGRKEIDIQSAILFKEKCT